MKPAPVFLVAMTILTLSATSAFSEIRECPQVDGTPLYTILDLPGCTLMTLKELSVVPSLDNMPTYRPIVTEAPPPQKVYPDQEERPYKDNWGHPAANSTWLPKVPASKMGLGRR
jgi:hypothetical protein